MINGHIDTVTLSTHASGDRLSEGLRDGCIYGRGYPGMKAGVVARIASSVSRPNCNVILAAVSDDETLSKGAQATLAASPVHTLFCIWQPTALFTRGATGGTLRFDIYRP